MRGGKLLPWISTPIILALTIVLWKVCIAVFDLSPFVLPQPEDVWGGMKELVSSPGFWTHVRPRSPRRSWAS